MIKRALIGGAIGFLTQAVAASVVTVNFESDAPGPKPNGFMSNDSSFLRFSDTAGSDLVVDNFGIASIGQGLAVGTDTDGSLLLMEFDGLVDSLSLDFGNDDPAFTFPGDVAILIAYLDGIEVGQTFIEMNGNTAMDQNVSFSGELFNSATFEFYVTGEGGTEVVDNISFNIVPGPGALALLGPIALISRRRRKRDS